MSRYDDVLRIAKKLEKMIDNNESEGKNGLDLLKALRKQQMTLEILEKTHIGMLVNKFRRCCKNEETVTLAKSLIKSWKKLLPPDNGSSSSTVRKSASSASLGGSSSNLGRDDTDSRDSQNIEGGSGTAGGSSSETSTPPHTGGESSGGLELANVGTASRTSDPVRIKCREMLASALTSGAEVDGGFDPVTLANSIEDHIYNEFKNTDMKYKNRVRSRITNLKDAKNPRLRENVLLGCISAERLARMTSEEMASDEMKNLRAQFTKQAIDEHQMATQSGTKSDLFKCGRCGQRDTTYNQVQTRSADEPMTTFVLCNNCGLRWKFC